MKPRCSNQRNRALTITEVLVTMVAVCLLALVALAQSEDSQAKAQSRNCVNNLKQINIAFRIWEGDNRDKMPMQVPARIGGAKESADKGLVYPIFQVMSNELSTPRVLICPADAGRSAAPYFTKGFDNSTVSYFVGVDATDTRPKSLLSGDDNFAVGGVPVKSGLLNVVANAPLTWTAARHVNQGNLGYADGLVWQDADNGKIGNLTGRLAIP